MNDILNKFLLAGDKFTPEMHLKQPQFTYSACGPFNEKKERIQKFKETGDSRYIYKNESHKAWFQHDMAYGDFKDLARRTAADKVLKDKAFNIAKDPIYDGHQRGLASIFYKFFDKKITGKSMPQNEQLAEELHKIILENLKKAKYIQYSKTSKLTSKFNKGFRFSLCVIDIFSKYAWVVSLKDKKCVSIVTAFQSILKKSNRKQNKIWLDKDSEFYKNCFKKWLQDNDIVIYPTHNEGKSVVDERFIRTLKNKIYKYMTSISKNVYIDKLDDMVNEYNNTYHRTIKMKPIDVKDNTYINIDKKVNDKNPKFKVGDHVRISKYKNIFAKVYNPNWSEEIFGIKKMNNSVPLTYVINDVNGEEIIGTFYEKELQKTNQKEFRIQKVIKKKGNKLNVK